MWDNSDEYERQARECARMAKNSISEVDRASWLRIAQEWMRLLRTSRGNESQQVDQKDWTKPSARDSSTSH